MSNSGCIPARLLDLLILTNRLNRQHLRPLRGSPAPTGRKPVAFPSASIFIESKQQP